MVLLASQGGWLEGHRAIGYALGLFAIVAPIARLLGGLSRSLLVAAFGLFVLHGLQYAFIESISFVRALHAVNAVTLFWLATVLAERTLKLLR